MFLTAKLHITVIWSLIPSFMYVLWSSYCVSIVFLFCNWHLSHSSVSHYCRCLMFCVMFVHRPLCCIRAHCCHIRHRLFLTNLPWTNLDRSVSNMHNVSIYRVLLGIFPHMIYSIIIIIIIINNRGRIIYICECVIYNCSYCLYAVRPLDKDHVRCGESGLEYQVFTPHRWSVMQVWLTIWSSAAGCQC